MLILASREPPSTNAGTHLYLITDLNWRQNFKFTVVAYLAEFEKVLRSCNHHYGMVVFLFAKCKGTTRDQSKARKACCNIYRWASTVKLPIIKASCRHFKPPCRQKQPSHFFQPRAKDTVSYHTNRLLDPGMHYAWWRIYNRYMVYRDVIPRFVDSLFYE